MIETATALLATQLLFTAAFTLAFALPLAISGAEERAARAEKRKLAPGPLDLIGPLIDLWLILEDSVPVFWIFRLLVNAPEDTRAAKRKWKEEPTIRICFYISATLIATLPLYFLYR